MLRFSLHRIALIELLADSASGRLLASFVILWLCVHGDWKEVGLLSFVAVERGELMMHRMLAMPVDGGNAVNAAIPI